MSNIYPAFAQPYVTGGYPQPIGTVYNPQLVTMDNFNRACTIQKNFVKNNNEIYDIQSLQNAIMELGQLPMVAFTFPNQNIYSDIRDCQSPSFVSLKPTVYWLINETQLSEAIGVLSLLSTMFMTSCGKVRIKVKEGWQENASLYVLGISRSGSQKSVLIKRLRTPFEDYEQAQKKEMSSEVKRLAQQEIKRNQRQQIREALEGSISIGDELKKLSYEEQQLKKELISKRLLASTVTSPALLKILKDNNEAISFLEPEPRLFLLLKNDPKLLELFLSGYTGEAFSYDSAYGSDVLNDPCINLFIMCQPNEAQKFLENKNLSDRGLFGRFVPIFNNQAWENNYYNQQDLAELYKSKIQSLLEYFSFKEHIVEFSLTEEAQHLLQTIPFVNTQKIEPYNSFIAKGKGLIVRIATAIHLWNFQGDDDSFEISLTEIQQAITIVNVYIMPSVNFMYGRYNRKAYKMAYKILQRLYDISEPERYKIYNGILVSELKKMVHAKGTELDVPLELLSMHNFIRVLKTQNGTDKIILHPRFYQEFPALALRFHQID